MSNNITKESVRAQQRSLSQRTELLEQSLARVLFNINQRFGGLDQRVAGLEEQVEALITLAGQEEVMKVVNDNRLNRARAAAEKEKASLDASIAEGYVTASDKVDDKSVIVGKYTAADGTVVEPGRAQLVIPGVAPQFKDKLIGQVTGFKLDLPDGGHFELLEIYAVDETKYAELQQAKALKDAETAVAEAAAVSATDEAAVDE